MPPSIGAFVYVWPLFLVIFSPLLVSKSCKPSIFISLNSLFGHQNHKLRRSAVQTCEFPISGSDSGPLRELSKKEVSISVSSAAREKRSSAKVAQTTKMY